MLARLARITAFACLFCALAAAESTNELIAGLVRLPADGQWQVRLIGTYGAVLQSENPPRRLEIVAWDIPAGGEASPAAAAAAHETSLYRKVAYARTASRPFATASGTPGLLVTGQIKSDGTLQETAFVAFALPYESPDHEGRPGRYCVIGGFGDPGTIEALVDDGLTRLASSVQFAAPADSQPQTLIAAVPPAPAPTQPEPTPAPVALPTVPPGLAPPAKPAEPAAPAAPVLAGSPTPTPAPRVWEGSPTPTPAPVAPARPAPPQIIDVTPPPRPAPSLELVEFKSPLGFALKHPREWQVRVTDGRVEIASPTGDGSTQPAALAMIWPVVLTSKLEPAALARQMLQQTDFAAVGAQGLAVRSDGRNTILAGTVGVGSASRRLIACCHASGETGLLTALAARPDEFEQHLPALLEILASFEADAWWTASGRAAADTVTWLDETIGVLQAPMPRGWKMRGGLQNFNGVWTLFVEAASDDSRRLAFTWQQPLSPLFRDLTPVLRNLGWQEGDKYVSNPGDQPLRVLTRLSPQDFLTRYWLTTPAQRLENAVLDRVDERPPVAGLLSGDNPAAIVAMLRGAAGGQPRQRLCLVATADAPLRIGTSSWQAAVLQCEAPAGALEEALSVLRTAVEGAKVAPGSTHAATGALHLMLDGARRALAAVPSSLPASVAWRDVLAGLNNDGHGDLWLLPPAGLDPWRRATLRAAHRSAQGSALPELAPEFWK